MKPAPFAYRVAGSAEEAVSLLAEWDGEARLLAGGQSLVPLLNMRLVRPGCLVDVNRLDDLAGVYEQNGSVVVGALTRYSAIEWSPTVAARLPLLAEAVRHVGDRQIRTRGTVGGSLAHADPTGELPLAALALDATIRVTGPAATRDLRAGELLLGPYTTALAADEMITEAVFPLVPGAVGAFAECARRHGDFAVLSVAAVGVPREDGGWESVRIALGGVADAPFVAAEASSLASGTDLGPDVAREVGAACARGADPPSDVRASADYRRHLIPVYVERVLAELRGRREATGR